MIDAKELRLNNIIKANGLHEGRIMTVEEIGSRGTLRDENRVILFKEHGVGEFAKHCEGVELTPELLEKIKFDYLDSYNAIIKEWCFKRSFGGTGLIFHYEHYSNPTSRQVTLPYLHQLQNLFYVLTGEELNVEL